MKKKDRVILICLVVGFLIISQVLSLFLLYLSLHLNKENTKEDLMYFLNNSLVVKEHFGDIEDVNLNIFSFEMKYRNLDGDVTFIKVSIKNKDGERKKIKVLYNNNVTAGIYGIEIDDKLFYESVKREVSFVEDISKSIVLKEKLGDFIYVYKPLYASFKKYDDNYFYCDFIVIINNDRAKQVKVLVDINNSKRIYGYLIDDELIKENE